MTPPVPTVDEVAVLRDGVGGLDERAAALATTVEEVQSLTVERTAADRGFAEPRAELTAFFLSGRVPQELQEAVRLPAHDRGAYREEGLRRLAAGQRSVGLRSTDMHGQDLRVPVTGRISAVRGEDGQPGHRPLRAGERASR